MRSGGLIFFRAAEGSGRGPKRERLFPLMGMTALLLGRAERSTAEARRGTPFGVPGLTVSARAEQ